MKPSTNNTHTIPVAVATPFQTLESSDFDANLKPTPVDAYSPPDDFVHVVPLHPTATKSRGCRDWPFAFLFLLNVAAIGVCFFVWGLDTVQTTTTTPVSTAPTSASTPPSIAFSTVAETRNAVLIALGMAALSLILSLVVTILVSIITAPVIRILHISAVVVCVGAIVVGICLKSWYISIFSAFYALVFLIYAAGAEIDIPFVVANVRVASAAILRHWSTYLVGIFFTVAQTIWVILCLLVVVGIAKNSRPAVDNSANLKANGDKCKKNTECASNSCKYRAGDVMWISSKHCVASFPGFEHLTTINYVEYFFLLVALYWGLQVLRYISNTTAAGAVAAFWYGTESKVTTGAALCRSVTTSFGSICFGALLVAICDTLQLLADQSRSEGSLVGCLAECIVDMISDIVYNINHWAFVYVAMYGYKLTDAGKAVFDLFRQRKFNEIVEDDFTYIVLSIAAMTIGVICGGVVAIIAEFTDLVTFSSRGYFLSIMGLCIGAGVAITPLSVLNCAVSTIFVCFAEDPAAFAHSHPELYKFLMTEWKRHRPHLLLDAGYSTTRTAEIQVAAV